MQILSWQQKTTSVIFFSHQHNQGTPVSLFLWCTAIWKPLYSHFRVRIKFICLKSSIDASNNHVADRRDTRWIIWGCIATVGYIKRKINSVLFEYCIKKYFSLKLPKVEGNHISLLDSRKKVVLLYTERVAPSWAPPCLHHMTSHATENNTFE